MLFEPPIDDVVNAAGNVYIATVLMSARAKELQNKIPALLEGNNNLAIYYAAQEVCNKEVIGINTNPSTGK